MQKIVIDIPDEKVNFFLELLKNLGFHKVQRLSKKNKEFVDNLQQSLEQVEQHQEKKIELQEAKDFINEL